MGYELAGAWGARMARTSGEVFAFVGDGSYLMLNSELLSSVLSGHKLIAVLCDNGGFAVIERLQVGQGGASFNNMFAGIGPKRVEVDWVAHARALGCEAEAVDSIAELPAALVRARAADRTYVIALRTAPDAWTEGGAFWQVGVPEVSERPGRRRGARAAGRGPRRPAGRLVTGLALVARAAWARSTCARCRGRGACSCARSATRTPRRAAAVELRRRAGRQRPRADAAARRRARRPDRGADAVSTRRSSPPRWRPASTSCARGR